MYRYLGCGLDNVHLRNGYEVQTTASGQEVIAITDIPGLHRAIAENLCDAPRALTPQEFRFIRKELDMSQRQVALLVNMEEQTVSNWERGNTQVNTAAEFLLRSLMKETFSGNPEIRALMNHFCALDRDIRANAQLEFEVGEEEWRLAA